jgi:hypothetical protein
MEIFVQNQGMRKILPQAYNGYSEDKILSITPSLGEKLVLQKARIIPLRVSGSHPGEYTNNRDSSHRL